MRVAIAVALMLSVVPIVSAQSTTYTLEQVLEKMDANSRTFKSVEASIQRVLKSSLGGAPDIHSGKLYIQAGATTPRIKLELKGAEIALVDKGMAELYDTRNKSTTRHKINPNQEEWFQLLLIGFGVSSETMKKNYTVSLGKPETLNGVSTSLLEFRSIKPIAFPLIRLWLDQKDWQPVQTELTQNTKDTQTLRYSDVKRNGTISENVFKIDK